LYLIDWNKYIFVFCFSILIKYKKDNENNKNNNNNNKKKNYIIFLLHRISCVLSKFSDFMNISITAITKHCSTFNTFLCWQFHLFVYICLCLLMLFMFMFECLFFDLFCFSYLTSITRKQTNSLFQSLIITQIHSPWPWRRGVKH